MTRRIALTILLTVWAALVAAGLVAWLTTRSLLLAELDTSIRERALVLPELGGAAGHASYFPEDRFVLKDALDKTIARPPTAAAGRPQPRVLAADFVTLADGRRYRSLTFRFPTSNLGEPATLVYRAPADRYDRVLARLAAALVGFGVAAGAAAAALAARLSRLALQPLRRTTDVIGSIDEANLGRRIDAPALPGELLPIAARLNEMLDRLQQAFEQRRRFLADASHELRTPVAAMVTTLEVALRRPREPQELIDTLRACLTEARHMRRLVQVLLAQVRGDPAGRGEPPQPIGLAVLLGECADVADVVASERGVLVRREFEPEVHVLAPAGRLRSVVMNLMGNAIEHNRRGGTVRVSCRADNSSAELTVRDDGPGIPPEHLPHIFEPFYRASASRDGDGEHLGLGLFLVDSHVKAMGGRCRVESQPGAGAAFTVTLPLARIAAAAPEAQPA